VGHVACMGNMRNAQKCLVGRPKRQRPREGSRRAWDDIIRTNPKEIACEGLDWINLAQDRDQWRALVKTIMLFWVP
jgi:hypothetical protein